MSERPLRVLHVGNVANNAYQNARLLNHSGLDCDVLSYAHYHIMSCPEWEEGDFIATSLDESRPDWSSVSLGGYRRPRWFAQGPIGDAVAYLLSRREGAASSNWQWRWLEFRRRLITARRWEWLRRLRRGAAPSGVSASVPAVTFDEQTAIRKYAAQRVWPLEAVRRLFRHYDVIHAYGAEPILALAGGARPYVAFEHGTLRALPFEPTLEGRLTATAYQKADAVLITNADNRLAAERLGLHRFRFIPHTINETQPQPDAVARLRTELTSRLKADFLLFHPSRHHWSPERNPSLEKGNDRLIDAFASLVHERPGAAAVFVNWGATLEQSRERLIAHGIADRVHWIDPVPGPVLARYMAAADVVADQFYLGAFGAITPRALSLGVPALLYLDDAVHRWAFSELPPVLNAAAPGAIAVLLKSAYDDRESLKALGQRGRAWYERFHSNDVIRAALLETYRGVIAMAAQASA